jgi:hypothetical protein
MTGKHKEGLFRYLTHWSEERKLTGLLVALMFDTVIVYPLVGVVSSNVVIQIINSLVISAIFLLALSALCRRKITRRVLGWAVVIAISLRFALLVLRANWLLGWEILLSLLIVGAFLVLILRYVYKEGPVTRQRIQVAIAAYLLIAMAFALGYHLTSFLIPGALKFSDTAPDISDPRFVYNLNYFSITTITTLGYGDIIPVHPFTRTLTMIEALVGQLYPATLLARLVSLYILHSQRSGK